MLNLNEIEKLVLDKIKANAQSITKLNNSLNISEQELRKILTKLERELLIQENNGVYTYTLDSNHRIGVLKITKRNSGVVQISKNEVYFIDEELLNNAVYGDTVLIRIIDSFRHSAIIEDKKETERKITGTIIIRNKDFLVKADNPLFNAKLKLVNPPATIQENDKVYVSFDSKKDKTTYKVKEIEVLGNKYEVGVDITSIIRELEIEDRFTEEEIQEAYNIKESIGEEELKDRVDLRSEKIFTIDGKNSSDFDDALGITVLDNNNLLVKVCIADVDHYVQEGSILDQVAIKRTSSIYLFDRTIPMLPTILSNGVCSLNPQEDRLTITYAMEYDQAGNLVNYDVYPSVICSKQRMNYDDVEDVLTNPSSTKYQEFQDDLRLLELLRKNILSKRCEAGYIIQHNDERIVDYDKEQGKITNITKRPRLTSNLLVEEYMIAANICATLFAKKHNIPIIYRVQDDDPRETLIKKLKIIEKLGFKKHAFSEEDSTSDIMKKLVNFYKDDPNLKTILRVIRNTSKAYYTSATTGANTNHSSLNEKDYSHVTSPIRRYPDLYSSRQIKKYLYKERCQDSSISNLLAHINEQNDIINNCYHRTEGLKIGEYYEDSCELLPATIVNINKNFITFQLEDSTIGVIFKRDLYGFYFDEASYQYDNGFSSLKIGDKIQVEVVYFDKYQGKINYKIYTKCLF